MAKNLDSTPATRKQESVTVRITAEMLRRLEAMPTSVGSGTAVVFRNVAFLGLALVDYCQNNSLPIPSPKDFEKWLMVASERFAKEADEFAELKEACQKLDLNPPQSGKIAIWLSDFISPLVGNSESSGSDEISSYLLHPKKPTTAAEIRADIEAHPNRGKINGQSIVRKGKIELRGYVPKPLYDEMIHLSRALSFSKADAAICGGWEALDQLVIQAKEQEFVRWKILATYPQTRLFRGNVPTGLYEMLDEWLILAGYEKENLATLVLTCFVAKYGVRHAYNKFVSDIIDAHGVTRADVEKAFEDDAKDEARKKRENLSLERGGAPVEDEKMD